MAKFISKRIYSTKGTVAGVNVDTLKIENRNATAYGKKVEDTDLMLSVRSDSFMPAKVIDRTESDVLRKMTIDDFMVYSTIVTDDWKKAKGVQYIFRTMKKSKVTCAVLNPLNSAIEEKVYYCTIAGTPSDDEILSVLNKDLFKSGKHTSEKYAFSIIKIETEETKRAITLSMFIAKSTICTEEEAKEAEEAEE